MITKMHIENFKCFKDFDIELGPFNVLVGPNDSGKTAFLQAIRLALAGFENCENIPPEDCLSPVGVVAGPEIIWRNDKNLAIRIRAEAARYGDLVDPRIREIVVVGGRRSSTAVLPSPIKTTPSSAPLPDWRSEALGRADYYRLDPACLRQPSSVSQKMECTGEGFPTFLGKNCLANRQSFDEMEKAFYKRCPYYNGIEIEPRTIKVADVIRDDISHKDAFALNFHTIHGEKLSASGVSDGVMLSLAYLALAYTSNPPKILLLEEPENGIHHVALKDIVKTLRTLSETKGVQVIMTTHSPFLLDLVEPEEVLVFAKNQEGEAKAVKLSDYPDVADMKKHFMSGEIWTTFEEADIVAQARGGK